MEAGIFALLKKIPLRWWLYLAGAAVVAGLLWHDRHESARADALDAEKVVLAASLANEKSLRATEQADRSRSDDIAKKHAQDLADIAAVPPIAGVRCRATRPTGVPAEGHTAAGSHDPAAESHEGVPEADPLGADHDVSAGADWFGGNCQAVAMTLVRLQEFEAKRTH